MTQQDEAPDPGARIHRAAHDPEFPARREAALAAIRAGVAQVALAQGFAERPQSWSLDGPAGRVSVHVFPNRFGFEAEIRLGFLPADGSDPSGPFAAQGHLTLDAFGGPVALIYLDVLDDPACLEAALQVLADHALPWLAGYCRTAH
ncbi:hypothetical protein [Szabonella alba]|uniref:Uncharacterized protein n=1 Tax=Szabonella alba TaxID=2804194 RepID=A0A8K0VAQ7_9RHOB|nr:hypothetical protein [Szabonella alba]MBL4918759.1 hypothetical protein [Szabonella alba]